MGARQSKRSVDITTGKEVAVEGSEVAVGAGGEGKLEKIEDLDTLKPQLNGDAHQEEQISEKEKKMQEQDERQENEKDNTNEKEIILSPVTVNGSGEGEAKEEEKNAEQQEVKEKKPKKEKVKKKWSFRSISFSKKDKQKPAKKEETNGECEKVLEEGADAAPVVAEVAETKVESPTEKEVSEKEPETPVTEPLTNGNSAPESPKDEVKQNGESVSVGEQPSPVEPVVEEKQVEMSKSEPVAEPPAPEEKIEEKAPEVEALPVNGLTIEEPQIEEKAPVIEETPVEQKIEAVGDSEVCSQKESSEVGSVEVPPPPLPSCPPPSSLTIFAESTMAPLGDTQNVDASIPSLIPSVLAQSNTDSVTQDKSEIIVLHQEVLQSDTPVPAESKIDTDVIISALGNENIDAANDVPPVVENVAVVSENSTPSLPDTSAILNPLASTISENITAISSETDEFLKNVESKNPDVELVSHVDAIPEAAAAVPNDIVEPSREPIEQAVQIDDSVKPVDNSSTDSVSFPGPPQDADLEIIGDLSSSQSDAIVLPPPENVNDISSEPNLPSPVDEVVVNNDSPILQRAPSDMDVSETMPPSDSFPPPPPPESCPDSITETSVSESLPPPMSEFSVPDAVLNSPTSETTELPGKDEIVTNGNGVPESNGVEENGAHHPHSEVNGFSSEDSHNGPGHPEQPSVEIPQVKSVSDIIDVPPPAEPVIAESLPSGDTAAE